MTSGTFLASILIALALCVVAGFLLFGRLLAGDNGRDDVLSYDPQPRSPRVLPLWFLSYLRAWTDDQPRQLTYRRDPSGRFRKVRR